MKLRIATQAEQDLRESMPQLWPEFMNQDPIVSTFWPRLYELYPDFQYALFSPGSGTRHQGGADGCL